MIGIKGIEIVGRHDDERVIILTTTSQIPVDEIVGVLSYEESTGFFFSLLLQYT